MNRYINRVLEFDVIQLMLHLQTTFDNFADIYPICLN